METSFNALQLPFLPEFSNNQNLGIASWDIHKFVLSKKARLFTPKVTSNPRATWWVPYIVAYYVKWSQCWNRDRKFGWGCTHHIVRTLRHHHAALGTHGYGPAHRAEPGSHATVLMEAREWSGAAQGPAGNQVPRAFTDLTEKPEMAPEPANWGAPIWNKRYSSNNERNILTNALQHTALDTPVLRETKDDGSKQMQ